MKATYLRRTKVFKVEILENPTSHTRTVQSGDSVNESWENRTYKTKNFPESPKSSENEKFRLHKDCREL